VTKLSYNLDKLEKSIFSLYNDFKTSEDVLKTWNISEHWIEDTWDKFSSGPSLYWEDSVCRVRMFDVRKWELIV